MKVLLIGSGGREHALAWKLRQSPRLHKLYIAPGNAGTAALGENVPLSGEDVPAVLAFVAENDIDLVVVGPEAPLAAGLSDALVAAGRRVFAPSKAAAALEYSKEAAKRLMVKYGIPTAAYASFSEAKEAIAYIQKMGAPIVVKADGLAAGKGVIVAMSQEEAIAAVKDMLLDNAFGAAGSRVVIEEYLEGEEVSILAFCDGKNIVPMVAAQDHKRVFDGDQGPNTGGMGAYSPAPAYTPELATIAYREVLQKTISGCAAEGMPYCGVLYAGLMLTKDGLKVLEYNARFGDPETQAVLLRLKTDLLDIIDAVLAGRLDQIEIEWSDEAAVCVVMAAGGYPGSYSKGMEITGIAQAEALGATVFHAGTAMQDGKIISNGGRVLGVTALGADIASAVQNVYRAVAAIHFDTCFYRRDIAHRALKK